MKYARYCALFFLILSGFFLVGLELALFGWIAWFLGVVSLFLSDKSFRKDLGLLYLSFAILAFTPINTDLSYSHITFMGAMVLLAIFLPYVISRHWHQTIKFHIHFRKWSAFEKKYFFILLIAGFFFFPFYLYSSGAYMNWNVANNVSEITRLFIGTQFLGLWDELFFIVTVFMILRKYFNHHLANTSQTILFTSFLYALGFTGWGIWLLLPFAWLQGYLYEKTENLLFIIAIHLSQDFILFLALLQLHLGIVPIFIY
jgi:membrane protease YdiL (CAAX protease family)